ncbi:MAG: heat-inducible transcriptional repressor HrcA [Acidimicrobiales bacterium]
MADDELDERRTAILRAVVEEYIETAQPVGSGAVAPVVNVSSATVRNAMSSLEQDGFLRQPHTSAGRVPTQKGYRHFVDAITEPAALDMASVQQVRSFFSTAHGELEQLLQDTSRLLSNLTDYAAVVVGPQQESAPIRSVQLVGLAPRVALLVVVLASGTVEKRTLELGDEVGDERLAAATAHLSRQLIGRSLATLPEAVTPTGDARTDTVGAAALAALGAGDDNDADHVWVGGAARMAGAFEAVDTVRQVLSILEQQYVVVTVLQDVLDRGLQVAIGSETGLVPLAECSLVVAPYEVEGEPAGSIAVLGPTRMHYPQALAAVAVVSRRLGRHLTDQ